MKALSRLLIAALALALVAAPVPASSAGTAASPARDPDPRFGVIAEGPGVNEPAYLTDALATLGASSWYSFGGGPTGVAGRVELLRPGMDISTLPARAQAAPGTAWIIGNEPNVPGQDNLTPEAFSDFLNAVAGPLKEADPTAVLVGPNVLNWDRTCTACPGYTAGHAWSEQFVADYRARYGDLPLSAWGMHVYSLDWDRLPLADAAADTAQLESARGWLAGQGLDVPIWLTEFGVIWGYDGIEPVQQPDGTQLAKPAGQYRTDLLTAYLDGMFGFLTSKGSTLRIERWYLYAINPGPEPYATAPAGIALLQSPTLDLTPLGARYRAWAMGTP